MQMLFNDMTSRILTKLEAKFWKSCQSTRTRHALFAEQAFEGAAKDVTALDAIIVKARWTTGGSERLAAIDRAILRLAIHELNGTDNRPRWF